MNLRPRLKTPESTGWPSAPSPQQHSPWSCRSVTALIGAVSGLIIALDRVGVIGGDSETAITCVTHWAEMPRASFAPGLRGNGDVRFEDETMYVTAKTPRHGVRVLADQQNSLQDVELSARGQMGERGGRLLRLVCRLEDCRNYYPLGVTSFAHNQHRQVP